MSSYVCPACGNEDEDDLIPIDGMFTIEVGDWNRYKENIKLYACRKCSCLQVNNFHFYHKDKS